MAFNFKEAEELLSAKNAPVEDEPNPDDEEDEIELIEPVILPEPQPEPVHDAIKPETAPSTEAKPTEAGSKPYKPSQAKKDEAAPNEAAEIDLMATVILPQGMQATTDPVGDEDEESTVIIPEDEQPDNRHNKVIPQKTNIRQSSPAQQKPTAYSPGNDPDEVKTVIFGPDTFPNPHEDEATVIMSGDPESDTEPQPLTKPIASQELKPSTPQNEEEEATVILSTSTLPAWAESVSVNIINKTESPADNGNTNSQTKDEPTKNSQNSDEVGTMILSSNPHSKSNMADLSNESAKSADSAQNVAEQTENLDIPTQKHPVVNPEAEQAPDDDHMATMIMSAADIEALTAKKIDPEIEEDDTLVMHINSYETVPPDKK